MVSVIEILKMRKEDGGTFPSIQSETRWQDPSGIETVQECDEIINKYLNQSERAWVAQQWHTYLRISKYIDRLRQMRQERWGDDIGMCSHPDISIRSKAINPVISNKKIDYEKSLKRIDNTIQTVEERYSTKKKGMALYSAKWAFDITRVYLTAVKTHLTRRGYVFSSTAGSVDDKYSPHEKTWTFRHSNSNDIISLVMLKDKQWVFDIFHNGSRTNYMVMNQSRIGSSGQGVPISMRSKDFSGIYTSSEARAYKSNWRRAMRWIYSIPSITVIGK